MALDDKSILNNKLSPLIEGQVPDFVQSDHPIFVEFLKDYYKFLEAGELTISTTISYVTLETNTSSYILNISIYIPLYISCYCYVLCFIFFSDKIFLVGMVV